MREIPDRWGDLGDFIRQQRETAKLSLRRLSEIAGISNPYLSQIERGLRKPSAEILQQIARALRISAETLYVRAGILDADRDATDLVSAILATPDIDDVQKDTLIRIYMSFRAEHHREDGAVVRDGAAEHDAVGFFKGAGPGEAAPRSRGRGGDTAHH